MTMSSYRVVGRLAVRRVHCAPLSLLTKRYRSVPANITFALPGYSWMLRTEASSGRPLVIVFHVLPKSVVRTMYGLKSPDRWASKATAAVPRDAEDAIIRPT